jgi:ribosomal protein L19E
MYGRGKIDLLQAGLIGAEQRSCQDCVRAKFASRFDTEGRMLNAGRRVATAEARITDARDRLIAHATTTCLVFDIPKGNVKG